MPDFLTPEHIKAITDGGVTTVVMVVFAITIGVMQHRYATQLRDIGDDCHEHHARQQSSFKEDLQIIVDTFKDSINRAVASDEKVEKKLDELDRTVSDNKEVLAEVRAYLAILIKDKNNG